MSRCSCKVDWLSFVLPITPLGEGSEANDIGHYIFRAICDEGSEDLANIITSELQPLDYGRAPYASGWQDKKNGITVWGGGQLSHFTVEISGRGMDYIREHGWQERVLDIGQTRASRVDIAVDLEQEGSPQELVAQAKAGRQTSGGIYTSAWGNTVYIGSRHSERYLRAYRYEPPHPRSHLLRLEAVYRRDYAKKTCQAIIVEGIESVARASVETFGFGELVEFSQNTPSADLSVYRPERNDGKTLRWLIVQAAPAFKRLIADGTIPNAVDFLNSYFIPDDVDEDLKE